jgi:hypothetical protein
MTMPPSFEETALAFLSPSLGRAELILAAFVALAFLAGAVRSVFGKSDETPSWRERRS